MMSITTPDTVLHLVSDSDLPFLKQVYGSTRTEELKQTDWNPEQKQAFIDMQFQAQHHAYSAYPKAQFYIIEYQQKRVGRIYLQERDDALLIIDLALLSEFRGRGIGSDMLQTVFARARQCQKNVQIHVEKFNPALQLYQRLGFQIKADKGVYLFLEWQSIALNQ